MSWTYCFGLNFSVFGSLSRPETLLMTLPMTMVCPASCTALGVCWLSLECHAVNDTVRAKRQTRQALRLEPGLRHLGFVLDLAP